MIGGAYLCYEGAEKIWELGSRGHRREHGAAEDGAGRTRTPIVSGAVRTDFILSAEIMVISLNEVADRAVRVAARSSWSSSRSASPSSSTASSALIVKMDDVGLHLAERRAGAAQRSAAAWSRAMPKLLAVLSIGRHRRHAVGRRAHPAGRHRRAGLARPRTTLVHHLEEAVHDVAGVGGVLRLARQHPRPRRCSASSSARSSSPSCTSSRSGARPTTRPRPRTEGDPAARTAPRRRNGATLSDRATTVVPSHRPAGGGIPDGWLGTHAVARRACQPSTRGRATRPAPLDWGTAGVGDNPP